MFVFFYRKLIKWKWINDHFSHKISKQKARNEKEKVLKKSECNDSINFCNKLKFFSYFFCSKNREFLRLNINIYKWILKIEKNINFKLKGNQLNKEINYKSLRIFIKIIWGSIGY